MKSKLSKSANKFLEKLDRSNQKAVISNQWTRKHSLMQNQSEITIALHSNSTNLFAATALPQSSHFALKCQRSASPDQAKFR